MARSRRNPEDIKRDIQLQRNRNLKARYDLDINWYKKQLEQQGGCGICGISTNDSAYGVNKSLNFSVDHCHTTGKIRGLLCNRCNRALGLFGEEIKILENAIKYLRDTH